jgi:hypothetical protein
MPPRTSSGLRAWVMRSACPGLTPLKSLGGDPNCQVGRLRPRGEETDTENPGMRLVCRNALALGPTSCRTRRRSPHKHGSHAGFRETW